MTLQIGSTHSESWNVSSKGYYSSNDPYFKFTLSCTLNSQSIANNTSNVTITLYLASKMSSTSAVWNYNASYGPWNTLRYSVNDGAVWNNVVTRAVHSSFNGNSGIDNPVLMDTWTGNIAHNSDGTLTLIVGYDWDQRTQGNYKFDPVGNEHSITVELEPIARYPLIRTKQGGAWTLAQPYIKRSGAWVRVAEVYVKVNGEWKAVSDRG